MLHAHSNNLFNGTCYILTPTTYSMGHATYSLQQSAHSDMLHTHSNNLLNRTCYMLTPTTYSMGHATCSLQQPAHSDMLLTLTMSSFQSVVHSNGLLISLIPTLFLHSATTIRHYYFNWTYCHGN